MKSFNDFTLDEWLFWLERRHRTEIQLRLENAKKVATRLNVCNFNVPVITVAGTNGKGSTVSALDAIYRAAGYSVGTYTSPHLFTFNERICVNQQPISDASLCKAFVTIEEARGDIDLSFFEMATLACLLYFKQMRLDLIILEVGMGGRLDATNIIDADLAIITTIDYDHQDYLGDTKEAIGYEKAGIFRPNQIAIYADSSPPSSIIEHANKLHTHLYCFDQNYTFSASTDSMQIAHDINPEFESTICLPRPNINIKAAVAAVMASVCLQQRLPVAHADLSNAMRTVSILGRQHLIKGDVLTLYDVAHNPQAVSLLVERIRQEQVEGQIHAVFSGLKDKDLCGLIRPMCGIVHHWYPAVLEGKRAASESLIRVAFEAENIAVQTCFSHPGVAYQAAIQQAKTGDLILVYGSFWMVSAVMAIHNEVLR